MDAQLEAISRQFPGWDAWRTGWLFVAEHVTGKTIAARRLGHLLIRVADAQIRAHAAHLNPGGPAAAIDAPDGP